MNPLNSQQNQKNANGAPSNLTPEQQAQWLKNAAYWEAERFRKYRGGGCPPVVFDFTPPFLFDCRLNCSRRMGIGDQLCLLSAIQSIADRVGHNNVRIWFDSAYPGSADVFGMGGLAACDPGDNAGYPPGHTVIPCRGHIMAGPIGDTLPAPYGEQQGNPVRQVFYNWGWHGLFGGQSITLRLYPSGGAIRQAQKIAGGHIPFVTCTPLEVSRHNNDCDAEAWSRLLSRVDMSATILLGCAPGEQAQLSDMVAAMHLPHKSAIIAGALSVWKSLVDLASVNYTGNSCGMWLAFASNTRTYLLQHETPEHRHNTMWNYKPSWNCKNIKVVKI